MTLRTKIEIFYGFYICSQRAFIHALLSRVPFALAGLSCYDSVGKCGPIITVFFTFALSDKLRTSQKQALLSHLTSIATLAKFECLTVHLYSSCFI